jgi:superoxide dismutase, Cu-Zn family
MKPFKLSVLLVVLALSPLAACKPNEEMAPAAAPAAATDVPAAAAATPAPAAGAADKTATATATLKGVDAGLTGTVTFTQQGYNVKIVADVKGARPGQHGFHVHEYGDCTGPDFQSAGAHLNPDGAAHGCQASPEHHPGDLGNLEVGPDGHGHMEAETTGLTVTPGSNSVVGKTVIFHEGPDDCVSRPAGNSGARLACGKIEQTGGAH